MLNGFWTVEFGSSAGMFGGGVLLLDNGKLWGGDAGYYYVGTYTEFSDKFIVDLTLFPFIEGYISVFRTQGQVIELNLAGVIDGDSATAQGHPKGMPHMSFGAKLTRRS
ncbi:T3SS negative regulator,GrlR [Granulicella rosea]|uniref:T3SS negative regulator,GrlR n=1 Tax=Granulicella rosea TaxID=474952 RepID=A0A239JPE3_9BACT|nr:GrlR family regulatory protein [Granulicella rosea]SNT07690.1 T3SS negative regulator,GrlR [Granulicella rosea]